MTDLVTLLLPFADAAPDEQIAVLCHLATASVPIDDGELNGAIRRAELLLATGGDPRRALELDGRAVTALANDLDAPERRAALAAALSALASELDRLPGLAAALQALQGDEERAWRAFAAALLADAQLDD